MTTSGRSTALLLRLIVVALAVQCARAAAAGILQVGQQAEARVAFEAVTDSLPSIRCDTPAACASAAESLIEGGATALLGELPLDFLVAVESVAATHGDVTVWSSAASPGQRCNGSAVTFGPVLNQHAEVAVDWLSLHMGVDSVYVVGMQGAWELLAATPLSGLLHSRGVALAGASWVARGSDDFSAVAAAAEASSAGAILSFLEHNETSLLLGATTVDVVSLSAGVGDFVVGDSSSTRATHMATAYLEGVQTGDAPSTAALRDGYELTPSHHVTLRPQVLDGDGIALWTAAAPLSPIVWSPYDASSRGYVCDLDAEEPRSLDASATEVGLVFAVWGPLAAQERQTQAVALMELESLGNFLPAFPSAKVSSADDAIAAVTALDLEHVLGGARDASAYAGLAAAAQAKGSLLWSPYDTAGQACSSSIASFGAVPSVTLEPALDYLTYEHLSTASYGVLFEQGLSAVADAAEGYLSYLHCEPATAAQEVSLSSSSGSVAVDELDVVVIAVQNATLATWLLGELGGNKTVLVHGLSAALLEADAELRAAAADHDNEVLFATTYYAADGDSLTDRVYDRYGATLVGSGELQAQSAAVQMLATAGTYAGSWDRAAVTAWAYGTSVDVDEGSVLLRVSSHAARAHALLGVDLVTADLTTEVAGNVRQPEPWNQFVEATRGYRCSFSASVNSSFYEEEHVYLGVVHSLSGAEEQTGRSMLQAEQMLAEQVNALGGVLGARVVIELLDGASDPATFAQRVDEFAASNNSVTAVMGGERATHRVAMRDRVEAHDMVLFSAPFLSGDECHASVLYIGGNGNMRVPMGLQWAMWELGTSFALLQDSADDGGYSGVLATATSTFLTSLWADEVASVAVNSSAPYSSADVAAALQDIADAAPSGAWIMATTEDRTLLREIVTQHSALDMGDDYPILSFAFDELDAEALGAVADGVYAIKGYFEEVEEGCADTGLVLNDEFRAAFAARFGAHRRLCELMETAYNSVMLWANVVNIAGSWDSASTLISTTYDTKIYTPSGANTFASSHQMSRFMRVAMADGGRLVVQTSSDSGTKQEPWNHYDPANGEDLFECDHSSSSVGSKSAMSVTKFGIMTSVTGEDASVGRRDTRWILAALHGFNTGGGVYSTFAEGTILDCASNATTCAQVVQDAIDAGVIDVFYSALPYRLSQVITPITEAAQKLVWHFKPNLQPVCSYYQIEFAETPNMLIPTAVDYLAARENYYVLDNARHDVPESHFAEVAVHYITEEGHVLAGQTLALDVSTEGAMDALMADIASALPHGGVILNLVDDDTTNKELFAALAANGFTAALWPVISTSLPEYVLQDLPSSITEGHFAVSAYFSTISSSSNKVFKSQLSALMSESQLMSDFISSNGVITYSGGKMFKKVVEGVRSFATANIMRMLTAQSRMDSAMGKVSVAVDNYQALIISVATVGNQEYQLKTSTSSITAVPFWDASGDTDTSSAAQLAYSRSVCDHSASCGAGEYGTDPLSEGGCTPCEDGYYRGSSDPVASCLACPAGSVPLPAKDSCYTCPYPNLFSFSTQNTSCDVCDSMSLCNGGTAVIPQSGNWHSSEFSTLFHECLSDEACIYTNRSERLWSARASGDEEGDYSLYMATQCANGYTGPLCGSCAPGWGRTSGLSCSRCNEDALPEVFFSLLAAAMFAVLIVGIRSAIGARRTRWQMRPNHIMKISVSFVQFTSVLREVDFKWPQQIAELLEANGVVMMSTTFTSMDCVLSTSENALPFEIQKTIVYMLLPFVVTTVFSLFWIARGLHNLLRSHKLADVTALKDYLSERLLISANVTVFVLWPSVVFRVLALFNCEEVDVVVDGQTTYVDGLKATGSYLVDDTSVECFTGDHAWALKALGYPGIVVVCVGVPVSIACVLYTHRKRLDEDYVRRRFGFLYYSYDAKHYYWEIVIMGRKLAMAMVAVYFRNEVAVQILVALAVGIISLLLQWIRHPFYLDQLDMLETTALVTVLILLYMGQFFYIDVISDAVLTFLSVLLAIFVMMMTAWLVFQIGLSWIKNKIDSNGDGIITVEEFEAWANKRLGDKFGKRFITWYMARVSSMPAAMQQRLLPVKMEDLQKQVRPERLASMAPVQLQAMAQGGKKLIEQGMQGLTSAFRVKRKSGRFGGAKNKVGPTGGPQMLGQVGRRHSLTDASDPHALEQVIQQRRRNSREPHVLPAEEEAKLDEDPSLPPPLFMDVNPVSNGESESESEEDVERNELSFMTESELLASRERRHRSTDGPALLAAREKMRRKTEIAELKAAAANVESRLRRQTNVAAGNRTQVLAGASAEEGGRPRLGTDTLAPQEGPSPTSASPRGPQEARSFRE